jgi:hypothetical protein
MPHPVSKGSGSHPLRLILTLAVAAAAQGGAGAATALYTPAEQARLVRLTRENAAAHAHLEALLRAADAALPCEPNPIRRIQTEGKLAGDPVKVATQASLGDMGRLGALGFAYFITGDARYAAKARSFILAWARTNQPTGDPIDETNLEPLIEAYDQTRDTFPAPDRAEADGYLRSLIGAEWGARQKTNNWQSHRIKVVGLSAYVLGDGPLIERAVDGFRRQLDGNLRPDGTSLDFAERDALHYHVYDLEPLLTFAIAASKHGLDFYDYAGKGGGSLRKSVMFLLPYCTGEKQHPEFVNSTVPFDRKRAQNGEKGYIIGHLFTPMEGFRALCLASYFDRAVDPEIRVLQAGNPEAAASWILVLNAAHGRP